MDEQAEREQRRRRQYHQQLDQRAAAELREFAAAVNNNNNDNDDNVEEEEADNDYAAAEARGGAAFVGRFQEIVRQPNAAARLHFFHGGDDDDEEENQQVRQQQLGLPPRVPNNNNNNDNNDDDDNNESDDLLSLSSNESTNSHDNNDNANNNHNHNFNSNSNNSNSNNTSQPKIIDIINEAKFTDNWNMFIQHIKSHPEELYVELGNYPNILSYLCSRFIPKMPPTLVLQEIIKLNPSLCKCKAIAYHNLLPIHVLCEKIANPKDAHISHIETLWEAYPQGIRIESDYGLPLHEICYYSETTPTKVSNKDFILISQVIKFLCNKYNYGCLIESQKRKKLPIQILSQGFTSAIKRTYKSNTGKSLSENLTNHIWYMYLYVLKVTHYSLLYGDNPPTTSAGTTNGNSDSKATIKTATAITPPLFSSDESELSADEANKKPAAAAAVVATTTAAAVATTTTTSTTTTPIITNSPTTVTKIHEDDNDNNDHDNDVKMPAKDVAVPTGSMNNNNDSVVITAGGAVHTFTTTTVTNNTSALITPPFASAVAAAISNSKDGINNDDDIIDDIFDDYTPPGCCLLSTALQFDNRNEIIIRLIDEYPGLDISNNGGSSNSDKRNNDNNEEQVATTASAMEQHQQQPPPPPPPPPPHAHPYHHHQQQSQNQFMPPSFLADNNGISLIPPSNASRKPQPKSVKCSCCYSSKANDSSITTNRKMKNPVCCHPLVYAIKARKKWLKLETLQKIIQWNPLYTKKLFYEVSNNNDDICNVNVNNNNNNNNASSNDNSNDEDEDDNEAGTSSKPSTTTPPIVMKAGRLPLNVAIEVGMTFYEGLHEILELTPQALGCRDSKTHLYPFMLAAVGDNNKLDTVYKLLRESPIVASGLIDEAPWLKQKKKMELLVKEKNYYKNNYELLQTKNKQLEDKNYHLKNENSNLRKRIYELEQNQQQSQQGSIKKRKVS